MTDSLLPKNSTPLDRAAETVIDVHLRAIPNPHRALWNPTTCPMDLLPWLAWQMGVEAWRSEWPEHIKRAIVRNAIQVQRRRGTIKSVRDTVESFGGAISIREWWQTAPKGTPHTFELVFTMTGQDGEQASAAFVQDVMAEVSRVKPARSHFTFIQGVAALASLKLAAVARPVIYARLDMQVQ
ncbi:phage tail protein I [Comamonas testosteroni]|uniref:Phage tail protein I n=1 Tax=Comamonas testosteroni TaxID=285 RepID=A0A373FQH7_COMTE|nr:phage tail protein I [Comamonas testosteroni]RGE46127.1 phage tail protein I [Comamonas testosteroni]